jgi:hypothetical protein
MLRGHRPSPPFAAIGPLPLLPRAAVAKLLALTSLGFTAALLRLALFFLCHNGCTSFRYRDLRRVHGSAVEGNYLKIEEQLPIGFPIKLVRPANPRYLTTLMVQKSSERWWLMK